MPTYDVTFKVEMDRTVRVDADDEDSACEQADDRLREELSLRRGDLSLYSCEIARKDDDA